MYITKCYALNVVNGEMSVLYIYTVGQSSPTSPRHLVRAHHQVRNVIQILQHLDTHLFGRTRIRVDVREDSADGKAETQLGLTNSAIQSTISDGLAFRWTADCKLQNPACSCMLALLQPVQEDSHGWMRDSELAVEAVMPALRDVRCPRSVVVEVGPQGHRKRTGDPSTGLHLIGRRATPATRQPLLQRRSRHQRINTYCKIDPTANNTDRHTTLLLWLAARRNADAVIAPESIFFHSPLDARFAEQICFRLIHKANDRDTQQQKNNLNKKLN